MSWRDDLRRLEINEPAGWPAWFIVAIAALGCAGLGYGSWSYFLQDQRVSLDSVRQKEVELKRDFSVKKGMVVNLPAYRAQMVEIEERLAFMVEKLPDSTEVPSLLIDITEAGSKRGLNFTVFDPQAQQLETFYSSLSIGVQVKGTFYQLASFISDLAQMPRIVTVATMNVNADTEGLLTADLMLKTYSYVSDGL